MMQLNAAIMDGRAIRLEPYSDDNRAEVAAALNCDSEAWSIVGASGQGVNFDSWWRIRMAELTSGTGVPFAIRRLADGAVVGTSSYLELRAKHRSVEIGATFLRPEVRSGIVNPEAKHLMLAAAFGVGAVRVEILTDLRNRRSQAAIAKLGATREGVLRQHKITWTGHVRDTVCYSILDREWPAVKAGLEARMAELASAAPA